MSEARYFVFERDGDWMVALDGTPIGRHATQPAAVRSAIVMADLMGSMQHDADVMVEADGALNLAWSYGTDQIPTEAVESR